MNDEQRNSSEFNRRGFLKGGSLATLMAIMGGVEIRAQETPKSDGAAPADAKPAGPAVKCGVIGCGYHGRDILNAFARSTKGTVIAVCDTYPTFLRRAKQAAPNAEGYSDYKKLLENKDVQAVIIATPTHLHREVTLAALQAGKHVYCEMPLAHTVDEAKVIAKAAKAAEKLNFQVGLQMRSEPQRQFLLPFIRSGAAGKSIKLRGQWHKKQSWRRTSPNPERDKDINWRLNKEVSLGLVGEVGIHQVDVGSWFLNTLPTSVTGYGGVMLHSDGRDVPDTIQAVFEYPGGILYNYEASLGNSFDSEYDILYGSDSAVMLRGNKAWMFKEVDSPLLGWEVYARKDQFYKETGIALVANATKQTSQGEQGADDPSAPTPLSYALDAFCTNTALVATGVEDFVSSFGDNAPGLKEYLEGLAKSRLPAAGYKEGFEATVVVAKANEAILKGQKLTYQKELFEI